MFLTSEFPLIRLRKFDSNKKWAVSVRRSADLRPALSRLIERRNIYFFFSATHKPWESGLPQKGQ